MSELDGFSVKLRHYKCFGEQEQGFDEIKPINIIIGRNNSGKSTLTELIGFAANHPEGIQGNGGVGKQPEYVYSVRLSEGNLRRVFQKNVTGGQISGDHWRYGQQFVNSLFRWSRKYNNENSEIELIPKSSGLVIDSINKGYFSNLAVGYSSPLVGRQVEYLNAERDIGVEKGGGGPSVSPDGKGATNLIQQYINMESLQSNLVEEELLDDLNSICEPDSKFTRITVQQINESQEWEINFEEDHKGRVSMRNTGSGFKTILLVLIYLNFLPKIRGKHINSFIFCFEELENYLHPSLLRRLLLHIKKIAEETKVVFFITTHSSIPIDLFSKDEIAQILHVTHDGKNAEVKTVKTYIERAGILDDLDIRASDLLQANCIIWVEGPTDRMYFNKWVELYSEGELREGAHYQCVIYGGRLLSHLSAESDDQGISDAIQILKVNRNAIVIMDSDKSNSGDELNKTKQRIESEVEGLDGFSWVTDGREIENYIPMNAIRNLYEVKESPNLKKYGKFKNFLENIKKGERAKYLQDKVKFAEKVIPMLELDDIKETLDLDEKMSKTISLIKRWNGMSDS